MVLIVQEQVNDKTVAIAVKATKLTARLLAQAMQAALQKARNPTEKRGKQSLKQLTQWGAPISNVEVSGDNIGLFKKTAREHRVAFCLKRDDSENPPKWIVFFKAKDSAKIEAAFNDFSRAVLRQKNRNPSMLADLAKYKELTRTNADPVKNRDRGGHEL